jgi:hypothetical protein
MECNRCGGLMMQETVIKLQRRFVGVGETRFLAGYCAWCKTSVPMDVQPASGHQPLTVGHRPTRTDRFRLPSWLHAPASQADGRAFLFPMRGWRGRLTAWMPS